MYIVNHLLAQNTAHESLLKSRRQVLHQRIAVTLRDHFPALTETEPAMTVHHFAGRADRGSHRMLEYIQARRRFAFAEGIAHLGTAIDLADSLAEEPERRLARLRFQIAYANAYRHARGPGAFEPTTAFARTREIAARVGDAPDRFSADYAVLVSHWAEAAADREAAEASLEDIKRLPESSEASLV